MSRGLTYIHTYVAYVEDFLLPEADAYAVCVVNKIGALSEWVE